MSNMVINTNVLALNSHRAMKDVGMMQSKASQRLSSGLRINSAADDAAGLAISEKMRAQIRGLDQASKNSQDAISLIQTAEGGMQEIDNMLQRIRELTVQVSNDTNEHNAIGTGDRQKMQDEVNQLVAEIDSMSERVEFNKKKVINGDYANLQDILDAKTKQFQVASEEQVAAQMLLSQRTNELNAAVSALQTFQTASVTYAAYLTALDTFNADNTAFNLDYNTLLAAGDVLTIVNAITSAALTAGDTTYVAYSPTNGSPTAFYDYLLSGSNLAYLGGTGLSAAATAFVALGDLKLSSAATFNAASQAWNADTLGQQTFSNLKLAISTATNLKKVADNNTKKADTRYDAALAARNQANQALANSNGRNVSLYFQVGANAYQGLEMYIGSIKSDTLGIGDGVGNATIDFLKETGADTTGILDTLDTAISYVTSERSKLGAAQNRLEYTIKSLDISSENLSASESRIRDADMAKEMMNLTKANVLQQAATSMLAQANQAPQNILQLLR